MTQPPECNNLADNIFCNCIANTTTMIQLHIDSTFGTTVIVVHVHECGEGYTVTIL